MSDDKTPRERFVEAMKDIATHMRWLEECQAASDAFADQECACIHDGCFDCAGHEDKHFHNVGWDHSNCRAALRKEIGL